MASDELFGGWFGNNRHICDVLEDMRSLDKIKNYSGLSGLIEEAQMMANRMEAALQDQKDLNKLKIKQSKARKAFEELEEKYKELKSKVELEES